MANAISSSPNLPAASTATAASAPESSTNSKASAAMVEAFSYLNPADASIGGDGPSCAGPFKGIYIPSMKIKATVFGEVSLKDKMPTTVEGTKLAGELYMQQRAKVQERMKTTGKPLKEASNECRSEMLASIDEMNKKSSQPISVPLEKAQKLKELMDAKGALEAQLKALDSQITEQAKSLFENK